MRIMIQNTACPKVTRIVVITNVTSPSLLIACVEPAFSHAARTMHTLGKAARTLVLTSPSPCAKLQSGLVLNRGPRSGQEWQRKVDPFFVSMMTEYKRVAALGRSPLKVDRAKGQKWARNVGDKDLVTERGRNLCLLDEKSRLHSLTTCHRATILQN